MVTKNKLFYIDYVKVHQHLSINTDEVYEAYAEFINRLNEQGYRIIATTEFGDKTHRIEITVDDNKKLIETKIE